MEERRKIKRKFMIFFGRVTNRKTAQVLGNVADLTTHGIMIISSQPIPVNQNFELRIEVKESISSANYIDLEARSIWCNPDIDPTLFNTGFELINVPPETAAIIEQIIKEYGIRD